ncbi:DUF5706 domain-containing protein [Aldersonia sp. NBC_00410]|uniref:Pycsar system effector family protein n=1 Tax=Aldersonia sp. NBC_00410 TaxID=2975954 RepID=UPI00224E1ECB|nr:Pycsar system effector family protein [Aldersonia sp. NBC_00410]MCX5046239.1 DUF5706 domain-containing protein [Aldersonia sp. NBC_00410]
MSQIVQRSVLDPVELFRLVEGRHAPILLGMTQQDDAASDSTAADDSSASTTPPEVNIDHAWKLLSLVNEWIRHADAKATATLAFAGALGALLYNLVKNQTNTATVLDAVVVAACLFLGATILLCGLTLAPRIRDKDAIPEDINRVFFASIAQQPRLDYRAVLRTLTEDAHELIRDLADQIHANAQIATKKNTSAKWAIRALLAAGVCLAIVAILIAR